MRAYININQKAFSELAILKDTKIDLIDATIFEYIVKFAVSNKANKQLIDNKLFIWCSYQKIIDDNPLLNINSKKAIELRLNKLIEIGLFEKFTDRSKGNKTYFNVTDLAYSLVIENTNLSNEDYKGVSKNDYYNSKLDNSKLNITNEKEDKQNLNDKGYSKEFEITWKWYGENTSRPIGDKKKAYSSYLKQLKIMPNSKISRAIYNYVMECKKSNSFTKHLVSFLNGDLEQYLNIKVETKQEFKYESGL